MSFRDDDDDEYDFGSENRMRFREDSGENNKKWLNILVIVVVVAGLFFYFQSSTHENSLTDTPSPNLITDEKKNSFISS